jgi:hypothetical protein
VRSLLLSPLTLRLLILIQAVNLKLLFTFPFEELSDLYQSPLYLLLLSQYGLDGFTLHIF